MRIQRVTRPRMPVAALAVLAVLAVVVLAACGSSSSSGSSATPAPAVSSAAGSGGASGGDAVTIADFAFSPPTLTVKAGTTVTWTNNDGAAHDVTSTDGPGTGAATTTTFSSGAMAQGDTFQFTFKTPGTYYYECTIHAAMAAMHGEVVVQ